MVIHYLTLDSPFINIEPTDRTDKQVTTADFHSKNASFGRTSISQSDHAKHDIVPNECRPWLHAAGSQVPCTCNQPREKDERSIEKWHTAKIDLFVHKII